MRQVALYFGWLNSFTRWLVVPAAVGVCCYAHMTYAGLTVDDHPCAPAASDAEGKGPGGPVPPPAPSCTRAISLSRRAVEFPEQVLVG